MSSTDSGPPSAGPPARRSGWRTALMIIAGVILLFPGLCALAFGAGGPAGGDPMITMIVLVCLLVSAGGIWLIAAAIGGRNAKGPRGGP